MSEAPRAYSALSAEEQAQLSLWIDGFQQSYEYEGAAALKKAIASAPEELRPALLGELLPPLVDRDRKRHGRTPTLHELRVRFPELAAELTAAYPSLPLAYRLPVELRGYRVLQVVGEGGQAVVLRAQDDVHSAVAIKVSAAPEHNELILRERRLLGECSHPGMPEVIASGVEEERAFFVMPFLRGMTLADKYATHRPEPAEAARIASELCGVVDHLHSRGVLHRDIKPQNVWLDEQGGVKLIDLGMAIDRSSWGRPREALREFHGTPAFMSPEQACADPQRDGELSDQFAIGATFYWMLTGSPPFEASDRESTLSLARAGAVDRTRLRPFAGRARAACLKALSSRPGDRFRSAAAFGDVLRELASRRSRWNGYGRPAVAIAGTVIVAIVAAVGVWGSGNFGSRAKTAPEGAHGDPRAAGEVAVPPQTPADPRDWILHAAESNRIDLDAISVDDFRVAIRTPLRATEPWGRQPYSPSRKGVVEVAYDAELEPIADAFEYRLEGRPWRPLRPARGRHTCAGELTSADLVDYGRLQLRVGGLSANQRAGPFSTPVAFRAQLAEDEARFEDELVAAAIEDDLFGPSNREWRISEAFSRRYGPVVLDIRFAPAITEQMRSVLSPDHDAPLRGLRERARRLVELARAFAREAADVQHNDALWVEIDFTNRRFSGPTRFRRFDPSASDVASRASRRLANLRPPVSAGRYSRFNLQLPIFSDVHHALDSIEVGSTRDAFPIRVPVVDEPDGKSLTRLLAAPSPQRRESVSPGADPPYRSRAAYYYGGKQLGNIVVPPIWKEVFVRGRYVDGSPTDVYRVENDQALDGFEVEFLRSPPAVAPSTAYAFFTYDAAKSDAEPPIALPGLPTEEADLWRTASVNFYATPPPGGAYFIQCSDVTRPAKPNTHPLYMDVEIPYLDRYGRLFGSGTFRLRYSDIRRMLADRVSRRADETDPLPVDAPLQGRLVPVNRAE